MNAWLLAFSITSLVEIPIRTRALRHHADRRWSLTLALLLAFTASALTHPFVYFAFPWLLRPGGWAFLVVAESFAVLVEAWWLRRLEVRDALLWALVANAASVAVGSMVRLLGWI